MFIFVPPLFTNDGARLHFSWYGDSTGRASVRRRKFEFDSLVESDHKAEKFGIHSFPA